eukprot:TRINITY_DN1468_c1_g1_i1.p1 TRINITY_DN1468_c1_g1~~TRINITY_DN1468_c1_g1_i1.p1  ORF type:complete len:407 (+),score=53.34 TRINITY_DN1468_c1_g1_i1:56-1276(+)
MIDKKLIGVLLLLGATTLLMKYGVEPKGKQGKTKPKIEIQLMEERDDLAMKLDVTNKRIGILENMMREVLAAVVRPTIPPSPVLPPPVATPPPLIKPLEVFPPVPPLEITHGDRMKLPVCTEQSQTNNGVVNDKQSPWLLWEPEKCRLRTSEEFDIETCLSDKKVLLIGDSLLRQLSETFEMRVRRRPFQIGKFDADQYQWSVGRNGTFRFLKSPTLNKQYLSNTHILSQSRTRAVSESDIIVYGGGLWDMGLLQTHINTYLDELIVVLKTFKQLNKPFAMFPVHHVNRTRCYTPRGERLCYRCSDPVKVDAYREAGYIAAACAGVPVFEFTALTSYAFGNPVKGLSPFEVSSDGIHYGQKVVKMEADILVNWLCGDFKLTYPDKCNVEEAKARWASQPTIHQSCK